MPSSLTSLSDTMRQRLLESIKYRNKSIVTEIEGAKLFDELPDFGLFFNCWQISWHQCYEGYLNINFSPRTYTFEGSNEQDAGEDENTARRHFLELQGGFIPKFVQHFESKDWTVAKTVKPSREEGDTADNKEIDVSLHCTTKKNIPSDSRQTIDLKFYGIDPTELTDSNPSCRVEYEAVEIPARTVYRSKIVCDDDPIRIQEEERALDDGNTVEGKLVSVQEATN